MDKNKRLKLIQRYVANWAIGPSTLRNQGDDGVAGAAREFLAHLHLRTLIKKRTTQYRWWLNQKTNGLMKKFPRGARKNWGAARKSINLFMVGAYFNKVLSKEYNLESFGNVLEVPLDGRVANKLAIFATEVLEQKLEFPGIKHLKRPISSQFQDVASEYARRKNVPRAELDIILWSKRINIKNIKL